ncbi:unnamed protein product [Phaeothamnion confervicola]
MGFEHRSVSFSISASDFFQRIPQVPEELPIGTATALLHRRTEGSLIFPSPFYNMQTATRRSCTLVVRRNGNRRLSEATQRLMSPDAYCSKVVRNGDYFGYLCTTLLRPPTARPAALAVRAFNLETSLLAETEPGKILALQVRMEWWSNALNELYANPSSRQLPAQPVIQALSGALSRGSNLTKRWFERMLEARLAELQGARPQSIKDLET